MHRIPIAGASILAAASLLASTSHAGGKETIYDAAGTKEMPAVMEFYDNGKLKKLTGVRVFCSRDCEAYDGWKIEVAGLGLIQVGQDPTSPVQNLVPPDQVTYIDDQGQTIDIYGVKVVLKRDTSWDDQVATIAGKPDDTKFFAYTSPRLGPDILGNELPLTMYFQQVFEYLDEDNSISLSQLGGDPYLVVTNTGDDPTAPVQPVVTRISLATDVVGREITRIGSPRNPSVFLNGQSGVPILGRTWDPIVRMNNRASSLDMLYVTDAGANLFLPGRGTLLVGGNTLFTQTVPHASAFSMPIPFDTQLLGFKFYSQVANVDGSTIELTNAIDGIIGSRDDPYGG